MNDEWRWLAMYEWNVMNVECWWWILKTMKLDCGLVNGEWTMMINEAWWMMMRRKCYNWWLMNDDKLQCMNDNLWMMNDNDEWGHMMNCELCILKCMNANHESCMKMMNIVKHEWQWIMMLIYILWMKIVDGGWKRTIMMNYEWLWWWWTLVNDEWWIGKI